MAISGKPVYTDLSVYEAAIERLNVVFDRFDRVAVSFSGGKDSTAVLNLTLEVARERGRLPLDVFFFDEEAIPDLTIDYCRRVAQNPDINFLWYCIPVKHRNACSRKEPWWYCWDPSKQDRWTRELPPEAITELKGFELGMDVPTAADLVHPPDGGTVCNVLGIRAQESLRRRRIVSRVRTDNWLMGMQQGFRSKGYPIYDWHAEDVWVAPDRFGWDYNETYDVYEAFGIPISQQRVCPPFGEEPLHKLHTYATCFPELWARMIDRVHGATTAARYARTDLYGNYVSEPPEGLTWKEYTQIVLSFYPREKCAPIVKGINALIRRHNKIAKGEIQDAEPDPVSGVSWRFLCKIAIRGDFKGRYANKDFGKAWRPEKGSPNR
jgi:predicted phosphoadenosine phosphosulfate sulfurtransferase